MKGFMLGFVALLLLALCYLATPSRQELASADVDQQVSQEVGLFGRGTVVIQRRSRQRVMAAPQAILLPRQSIVVPHTFVPQQQLIIVR